MRAFGKIAAAVCVASLALPGCGGDGDAAPAVIGGPLQTQAVTLAGPGGSSITIPPTALHDATPIAIAAQAEQAPAVPDGIAPASPIFAITPHGTVFSAKARVRLPYDAAKLPAGTEAVLWKANPRGSWQVIEPALRQADHIEVDVSSLSYFMVGPRSFAGFVTSSTPTATVSFVAPTADNWSTTVDPQLGRVTTLLRPTDVVLRTQLSFAPPCPTGWVVDYNVFGTSYERMPPYSPQTSVFYDADTPTVTATATTVSEAGVPVTGSGNFVTTIPWAAMAPFNNRVDDFEVRRTLAAVLTNNAVSPNGATFVGWSSVLGSGPQDYPAADFPLLVWVGRLIQKLSGERSGSYYRPAPPPTVTSVYTDNSRLISQFIGVDGPAITCNGVPWPNPVQRAPSIVDQSVFVATGNRLINISRGPIDTAVRTGWDFLMAVDVFNTGPRVNDHRVNVEWFRAEPGSDLFQTFATTTSTQFPGIRHSLQRASTLADNGSRWRAVACRIQDPSLPSDCVESPIATLTVTP
jgi:hypothetical protein